MDFFQKGIGKESYVVFLNSTLVVKMDFFGACAMVRRILDQHGYEVTQLLPEGRTWPCNGTKAPFSFSS